MKNHIQSNHPKGYLILTKKDNEITALSGEEIQAGDSATVGVSDGRLYQGTVKEILKSRPQTGHFNDESFRRTWYRFTFEAQNQVGGGI